MKIVTMTRAGVIRVDAHVRHGYFVTTENVDVVFDRGGFLRIPARTIFDGASIPPRARSIIQSLTTPASLAFLVHDWAYRKDALWISPKGHQRRISRALADRMAWAVCRYVGLATDDCIEVYVALRLGGRGSFHKLTWNATEAEWRAVNR